MASASCASTSTTAGSACSRSSTRSARGVPSTVEELVAAIYTDVAANLIAPAGRNVRANLELLAADGKVAAAAGERWQLTT